MAKLLDIGNLVLVQQDSQRVTWQSFDYPTNTMLPFMKLGLDWQTGLNRFLTSWKSKDDPGIGNYSFQIVTTGYPQAFVYMGRTILWRARSWTGLRWSGVPKMTSKYFDVQFVNNQDETTIMDHTLLNLSDPKVFSKMMVNKSGIMKWSLWKETRWVEYWSALQELCDKYLNCGPNSYCDPYNVVTFECKCFPRFEPKSSHDCMRKKRVSMCNNREGFVKLEQMKVPDTSIEHVDMRLSMNECKQKCLRNCSCMAYASANESEGGIGCLTWQGDLVDTRKYPDQGQDLYIRVDAIV
ncbi:G-type lectin S-receptor-like serine/threonine-protein kinase At1g11410 [Quercus suber]|uniref:G-type lectin S-receptor-like serine/threonine-protein kinase At1g11410 n=1 Tax=Quercus suber TaxID=58331 RepID=UPI000D26F8EE|nr:g-type lectin s-receptor-like serine/threonine-protein kinase rks1 [Quercus suber]